jgi:hypothetical protein
MFLASKLWIWWQIKMQLRIPNFENPNMYKDKSTADFFVGRQKLTMAPMTV